MPNICVIGCGPAGMMAAISAARSGCAPTVFEHNNSPGSRLLLTGGGRCNFTNDITEREFVRTLGRPGRLLGHALAAMSPDGVRRFFSELGVRSFVEKDGRVVPESQRAATIRNALLEEMDRLGCRIVSGRQVFRLIQKSDGWTIQDNNTTTYCDRVILATGGMARPETGSDGSGYHLARTLGHDIVNPVPAEVPLLTTEPGVLQGLTAENITLRIQGDKRPRTSGNLLFTHFGVSGPAVLDISGDVARLLSEQGTVTLFADFLPGLGKFENRQPESDEAKKLAARLPSRLASLILRNISDNTGQTNLFRQFPITVTGTKGFGNAMVTKGGVNLTQVDFSTMESRLVPGLYFAGEILDLDGPMGGFNLQIAWSTGFLAGACAARD